jgi:peptidoglycan-associated lipoprotein
MDTRIVIAPALALLLCACASRPPEPTAAATTSTATPPSSTSSSSAQSGTAGTGTPSGASTASAAMPRGHEVFFAFDSSAVSPEGQTVVRQNATYAQPRRSQVRLEGNADERGSREYNLALGQRRAEAVRQTLVLDGLAADRVEAVSYGKEKPRCTEETEDCFAENRRVDILVAQ